MAIPFTTGEIVTAADMNEIARAHWRKTTAKQVVNTVTETDLLNGEITIDAGAMSTNRVLRLSAIGDSSNNTGGTVATPRFKVKLGATTIVDTNILGAQWTTNAGRFGWRFGIEIANLGAANSQWTSVDGKFAAGLASAALAVWPTGEGITGANAATDHMFFVGGNSSAVDTTAAVALAFTVTLATASPAEDVTLKYAVVEIV